MLYGNSSNVFSSISNIVYPLFTKNGTRVFRSAGNRYGFLSGTLYPLKHISQLLRTVLKIVNIAFIKLREIQIADGNGLSRKSGMIKWSRRCGLISVKKVFCLAGCKRIDDFFVR